MKNERMTYEAFKSKYVIFEDNHRGYDFLIQKPFETHYCGYVKIPKNHKYHDKDYDKIDIKIHGDLSFGEYIEEDWWIGWDYNHDLPGEKDLVLIDIIKDCCSVIMQLEIESHN